MFIFIAPIPQEDIPDKREFFKRFDELESSELTIIGVSFFIKDAKELPISDTNSGVISILKLPHIPQLPNKVLENPVPQMRFLFIIEFSLFF